jgi:hypothetical protein
MKAQIFFLKSQDDYRKEIEPLLRRYVFEDIGVERLMIGDDYCQASPAWEHKNCLLYVELLKASMIKVDNFDVVVGDDRGNWCYMGGGHWLGHEEGYSYSSYLGSARGWAASYLKLFQNSLNSIFPAIAVMDRMVMVPHGIHEAFEKSRDFSWFLKPLDLNGVLLVDFEAAESVRESVQQTGLWVKREIAKLCRRHMSARRIRKADFRELGALLSVDEKYLEQQEGNIFAPAIQLTPRIVSGTAQLERTSQVAVEIQNCSELTLERVRVQVKGPRGVLRAPVVNILDLPAGVLGSRTIQFEVFANAYPYCPLEVLFELNEISETYTTFPIPLILEVSP